eukprot:2834573-Rhodomonas_salina.1
MHTSTDARVCCYKLALALAQPCRTFPAARLSPAQTGRAKTLLLLLGRARERRRRRRRVCVGGLGCVCLRARGRGEERSERGGRGEREERRGGSQCDGAVRGFGHAAWWLRPNCVRYFSSKS